MLQVCDGLQAAHDRGVVHGGIKPGHVFAAVRRRRQADRLRRRDSGPMSSRRPNSSRACLRPNGRTCFPPRATFHFLLTGRAPFASPAAAIADQPQRSDRRCARGVEPHAVEGDGQGSGSAATTSINHLRAEIDQVRQGAPGRSSARLIAAFDRYRDIEALLGAAPRARPASRHAVDRKRVRRASWRSSRPAFPSSRAPGSTSTTSATSIRRGPPRR